MTTQNWEITFKRSYIVEANNLEDAEVVGWNVLVDDINNLEDIRDVFKDVHIRPKDQ